MRRRDGLRLALALAGAVTAVAEARAEACAPGVADLRDGDATVRFQIETADTDASREHGLMFRKSLPRFSGMLFVYDSAQPVAFWMENTLIPLDMLFFDAAGRLTRIQANAKPLDRTPIYGGDNVEYVLEINGGLAETLGIAVGAELRAPPLDPKLAAWPCAAG